MSSATVTIDYYEFEAIKADHERLCFLLSTLGLSIDGSGGFVKNYGVDKRPENERATIDLMISSMVRTNAQSRF